jgi:PTS system nitrogen regulatory IIA component
MAENDFDLDQLAAYLHLTPPQVEKLASRDVIPGRKIAGKWRFSRADVHIWLESRIGVSDDAELAKVEDVLQRQVQSIEEEITISNLLRPELIKVPLLTKSPRKIVGEICEMAAEAGVLWDPAKMTEAILARESLHSTALDNGVAMLHPRRPMPSILAEGFVALGRSYQGIPFGGSRGILTDIFFLIASTDDRFHLRTLARLSRISPWIGLLDRFGARSQQELVRFSIVLARAGAWRFATQLAAAPEDGWPALIDERDQRVAHVGDRVLHPGVWMSSGLVLVRLRERGDVAANLRLLMEAEEPSLEDVEVAVDEPTLEP